MQDLQTEDGGKHRSSGCGIQNYPLIESPGETFPHGREEGGSCNLQSMGLKILLALPIREGNNIQIAPDLGIIYLGTALQSHGCEVTLLDCPKDGLTFRDFKAFLSANHFDVVGFRCYSRDHNYVNHHLKIVRQVHPKALTLVGGPHSSALPEFVLNTMPDLDFAWKAEAEEGLPLLLSLFEALGKEIPEEQLATIPGLVWRSKSTGVTAVNTPSFGADLDRYGMPAWELIKPDTYPGFIYDEYYPILTTRGCPYPCTYCNTPKLSGKKLRHRSVERIIEELAFLKQRYNIGRFSIVDDEFTLDGKYATHFCEQLIESGLKLRWDCPVGVRLDSLYPELLEIMEKAGCESMAVGIESGSARMQKFIQKKVTVETIREKAFMVAGCSRIKITGYFMIGFLDETEEEIIETINLAASLPLVRANFNMVIPIPGTAIFDEALRAGKIVLEKINWDTYTSDQVSFQRNHVSGKRLIQLHRQAYFRFYGRPRMLWQLTKDSLSNREVIWASIRNMKRLFRDTPTDSRLPLYVRESAI
jgi:anaerobic magnesium-protoporphyrin IX monomethyl ester cyclase